MAKIIPLVKFLPLDSFISCFIFSKCFILVDPEPTRGTLGMMQEYTLEGMPVYLRTLCTHIHTVIHAWGQFRVMSHHAWEVGESILKLQTTSKPNSGSNQ